MAKKRKAAAPAFDPVVVRDPYSLIRGEYIGKWLVVGRCFSGVRAIGRQVHVDGVTPGVVHRTINTAHKRHYPPIENIACASFLEGLKNEMLAHGATELAVTWALEIEPALFSEKELITMAEKLQGKGKPAAKKTETKAPAKKGGGNTEALAKARAARTAEANKDRKYKTLVKRSEIKAREGSWTATMVDVIMAHKSTDAAKEALKADKEYGDKRLDFNWAEQKGYIEFA